MNIQISYFALAAVLLLLQGVSASERLLMQDPLLTNNNNNLPLKEEDMPVCPDAVPVTDTGVPGVSDDQRLEISTQKGKAFRIFDCINDKPVPYSEYSAKISDIKGDWWGEMFYQDGFPIFKLNWADPYNDGKVYSRTIISFKEFVEVSSPDGTSAPWARYPIMSDDGTKPGAFKFVERTETRGGLPPESCGGQRQVQVPYEAYYYFYPCREEKKAEEEPMASPEPEAEPSPEPSPSPETEPSPEPGPSPEPEPSPSPEPEPSDQPSPVEVTTTTTTPAPIESIASTTTESSQGALESAALAILATIAVMAL